MPKMLHTTMKFWCFNKLLTTFLLILISAGCSTIPKPFFDKNELFEFSNLRSYHVLTKSEKLGEFTTLHGKRIANAIATNLNQSGFNGATKQHADFLVAYHRVIEKNFKLSKAHGNSSVNYGYSPYWRSYYSESAYIRTYDKGTLIIDIIDPKLKEVVWRGSISTKIKSDNSIQQKNAHITSAVNLILKDFPN